jgi:PAS domain S-box-containing protein
MAGRDPEVRPGVRPAEERPAARSSRPPLRQYGLAVGAALLAILGRLALNPLLGMKSPEVLSYPAIIAVAVFAGLGPGLLCALLCGVATLYLWFSPGHHIRIDDPAEGLAFAMFLAVCLLMVGMGRAQRAARRKAYLAGRAAQESERRTRDVLESLSDGFCALDREGCYAYVNAAAEQHFGVPRAMLLGRRAWEGFPEGLGPILEQRCRAIASETGPAHFDARSPSTGRWLEVSAYPSEEGLSVYFRDVTERKLAEQEKAVLLTRERLARDRAVRLQRMTETFSRALTVRQVADLGLRLGMEALNAAEAAAFLLGDDGQALELIEFAGMDSTARERFARLPINATNTATEAARSGELVVVDSAEECGRRCADAEPGANLGSRAAVPLLVGGRTIGCLLVAFREWRPLDDEERSFLLSLAHQCAQATERARLFDLQERARQEAEAANRLKDDFLATVSHELRTPLNAIVGWARVLRESPHGEALTTRALDLIHANARAQERLISDILDASRIVTGRLSLEARPLNPTRVFETAVEAVRPAAEAKGIRICASFDAGAARVMGDPDRLQQVAWNLLSNAVKFTPEGGRIDVSLLRRDGEIELSVRDTGEGIDPDFLPYVFDRFRQADSSSRRRHGGIGLGLALVRHLVEMHGGSVRGESPGAGKGASFVIRLPVAARTDEAYAEVPADSLESSHEEFPLNGRRVLIVDDEPDGREGLAVYLSQQGAHVSCAGTAREALAFLRREVPDVLIADIAIPDEDGYALIGRVRSLAPGDGGRVAAIAMTGYGSDDDRAAALLAGFDAHVIKPVDPLELVALILRLARTGEVRSLPAPQPEPLRKERS